MKKITQFRSTTSNQLFKSKLKNKQSQIDALNKVTAGFVKDVLKKQDL